MMTHADRSRQQAAIQFAIDWFEQRGEKAWNRNGLYFAKPGEGGKHDFAAPPGRVEDIGCCCVLGACMLGLNPKDPWDPLRHGKRDDFLNIRLAVLQAIRTGAVDICAVNGVFTWNDRVATFLEMMTALRRAKELI